MATVGIKIHKHHKKTDGTYNVKIRVSHKGDKKYIDTPHFVVDKQLTSKCTLKDATLKQILNKTLDDYRKTISDLGSRLEFFSAESLRDHLKQKDEPMDFFDFCQKYIDDLEKDKRFGTAGTLKSVFLSLKDYFRQPSLSPLEINEWMLVSYEKYLRGRREILRMNQGKLRKRILKGMNDGAVHNHFRDLRILFKAAMKYFNKPQIAQIRIPNCPFDNYKIVESPETRKRNLDVERIKLIRDCEVEPGSRAELARDLFMLSLYLCGTNAVDFYHLSAQNIRKRRIEYCRTKTQRRKDRAFISINLIDEAKQILDKYIGKLTFRYSRPQNLSRAINAGMEVINRKTGLEGVTFYWARHSFGNLARNKCRMSKDDVALALNHVDHGNRVTDIYIEKDWSIVDEVQLGVISLLRDNSKRDLNQFTKQSELRKTMYLVTK